MLFRYRIYHREEGKPEIERAMFPFTEEQKLREYDLLPNYLDHCFDSNEVTVKCQPVVPGSDGVIVELDSEKTEHEIEAALEECLIRINHQIQGLCLVVDRLPK